MIKAIIFDFDGVIVESANIKTLAFEWLFRKHPANKIKMIVDYHLKNMGISRFVKFSYIYKNILNIDLDEKEQMKLGKQFSDFVFNKVIAAPFVKGARAFLSEKYKEIDLFVISGTPETELKDIMQKRRIDYFFKEVHGSPKVKADVIRQILKEYSYKPSEVIFLGDAESDELAAKKNKVHFILRRNSENRHMISAGCEFDDFNQLRGDIYGKVIKNR